MGLSKYPKANYTLAFYGNTYPGLMMNEGKFGETLHSSETINLPSYNGGKTSPNQTYDPRSRKWFGHFLVNQSATALKDPDSTPVKENRVTNQTEILAYSDMSKADMVGGLRITDLTVENLDDLAAFLYFLSVEWGVELKAAPKWYYYPKSYGQTDIRFSSAAFSSWRGVNAHMHVPGNDHGDTYPNIEYMIAKAKSLGPAVHPSTDGGRKIMVKTVSPPAGQGWSKVTDLWAKGTDLWLKVDAIEPVPAPTPTPPAPPPPTPPKVNVSTIPVLPAPSYFVPGKSHPSFTAMGERFKLWLGSSINHSGNGYQSGPKYSVYDDRNVRAVQALMGDTPDPINHEFLGARQWKRLFTEGPTSSTTPSNSRVGFTVVPPPGHFTVGYNDPKFTWMGERFLIWLGSRVKHSGPTYKPGPVFSTYDRENVKLVQVMMGDPADGVFGQKQWTRLKEAPPAPPKPTSTGYTNPVPGYKITTPFGKPGNWAAGFHTGDDFACPIGSRVISTWTGKVISANWGAAYGTHVVVQCSGFQMAFCHLSKKSVKVGQTVKPGSLIGYSGNTGRTTGPHMHHEQRTSPYRYNNHVRKPRY